MSNRKCKDKGPRFERLMCGRLSLWVSSGTREDIFWRSAMSGGRARVKGNRKSSDRGYPGRVKIMPKFDAQMGDIAATHPLGHELLAHFVAECKFYKSLHWPRLVYGCLAPQIVGWWKDLLGFREETGREPLLLMKENRQPEVIATTKRGLEILSNGGKLTPTAYFPAYGMYTILWRDLVTSVDFSDVIEAMRPLPRVRVKKGD